MKNYIFIIIFLSLNQINAQYCTPAVLDIGCVLGDDIQSVTIPLANFSHLNTGCSPDNYGDFTTDSTLEINLSQDTPYVFSITHNDIYQYIRIWIDFNSNEVFENNESIFTSTEGLEFPLTQGIFNIPENSALGSTRMRIVNTWIQASNDPCSPNAAYGEVHDYTVNILPKPDCPLPINLTFDVIRTETVDLSWEDVSEASNGYLWEVYAQGDDPFSSIPVSSGTFPSGSTEGVLNNLTLTTDYDLYITSDCDTDGISDALGPIPFTTSVICPPPTNFEITNTAPDSVDFSWDASFNALSGYAWDLYLSGDVVGFDDPYLQGVFPSDSTSGTIAGLQEDTIYFLYIYSDCSTDGQSEVMGPVYFETPLFCPAPINVAVSIIGLTSIDLVWIDEVNATGGYDWELYIAGNDPDLDTPLQIGNANIGENTLTITGLSQNVTYDFYMYSNCEENGTSLDEVPLTFTTDALPPINDDICNAIPLNINQVCSGNQFTNAGSSAQENEPSLFCFSGGVTNSVWFTFVAPESGEVKVSTDIQGATLIDTEVAIFESPSDCTDPSTLGAEVSCDQNSGNNFVLNSLFEVDNLTPGDTYYIQVDKSQFVNTGSFGLVVYDNDPLCPVVTDVSVLSTSPNSVQFEWDSGEGSIESYNWYVFELGAEICSESPIESGSISFGENTAIAENLSEYTAYELYLESSCNQDNGVSALSEKIIFTTTCNILSAPYFQDFENLSNGTDFTPSCFFEITEPLEDEHFWTIIDESLFTSESGPNQANSGDVYVYANSTFTTGDTAAELETPSIDLSTLTNPALKFYYHMYGDNITSLHVDVDEGNGYEEDIIVLTGSKQKNADAPWVEKYVDLSAYSGSVIKLKFRVESPPEGLFGFIALDDIGFEELPDCLVPLDLNIVDVYYNSVEVSWADENSSLDEYVWEIYASGDEVGVDVPISTGTFASDDSQGVAGGLMVETAYDFYLKSACEEDNGESDYTNTLSFETTRLCSLPTIFEVTNIMSNSVELQWSSIPNATNGYNWLVYQSGDDPLNATPVASGNSPSEDNSIIISANLESDTTYDAYITTDCGVDGVSILSLKQEFKTLCPLIIAPYLEDFESSEWIPGTSFENNFDSIDSCWVRDGIPGFIFWGTGSEQTNTENTGPLEAFSGNNYLFTESTLGVNGAQAILVSPLIDISSLDNPALSFWYFMHGLDIGSLIIDIETATGIDSDVFTISGQQQILQNQDWLQQVVDLSPYAGQTISIIVRAIRGEGQDGDIAIDDISVEEAPSCFDPYDIEVISITDNSASISWQAFDLENTFDVEIVESGVTPTGNPTVEDISLPFSISDLDAETNYEVYVRADCGVDVSNWVGPVSFKTLYSITEVMVNAPSINYTYCYDNNEVKEWAFMSSDGETPVGIQFLAGTIEDGPGSIDRLIIYDGLDTNGVELFNSDFDGIDLAGLNILSNSGSVYMVLSSDGFGSCENAGIDIEIAFDFNVFSGTVSSVEFSNQNFKYYPNPVKSILTIDSFYPIDEIQIFDILGKEILKTSINSYTKAIDFNTIKSGMYIMKVKINNKTDTFKLLKK